MAKTSAPAKPRPRLSAEDTAKLTHRITFLSVLLAAVLFLVKLGVWLVSGSVSLLASLADSGLDVAAALGTFFAVRYAQSPPDSDHRYGHGKAEAFASLMQAGLVFASAALVGREAVTHFIHPEPISAEGAAIAVMAVSTLGVAALVFAQNQVLAMTQSVAVHGDRAHYIADIGCNIAALIGLGLALVLHEPRFDAAAGLVVALWLVWGAIHVLQEASKHLMDEELSDHERQEIVDLVSADAQVKGVHQLRTRAAGPYVHMQMHLDLDPNLTVEEAHHIMVGAENRVLARFPAADILIHPDPRGRAEAHGGPFVEDTNSLPASASAH
jgi:ferrous-iron efflux pump FieF